MKGKPILVLDFDGVIHSYSSGWKGASTIPDPPVPGAIEFILSAMDKYSIAILSSRSHQWGGKRAMKKWLREHLQAYANSNFSEAILSTPTYDPMGDQWPDDWVHDVMKQIKWPWFKPPAVMTIDDRALTFTGTWPTLDEIKSFKPWNKA